MRLPALALAALAALVLACGPTPASPGPTSAPTRQSGASTAHVYFYFGGDPAGLGLVPVARPIVPTSTEVTLRAALEALLAGPTGTEAGASPPIRTGLPAGLRLLAVDVDGPTATIDLSDEINASNGDGDFRPIRARLAQIVFTVTQLPEVTGVLFKTDGSNQDVVDRDGNLLFRPLTRGDYADALAPIFVDAPAWGSTARGPLALGGLADVFEAQFRFRLLDADGRSLADGQLTASCGSGCRGTFGVSVPFNVQGPTPAHLQVFDLSEADGSMIDLVDYPLTLLP